MQEKTLYERSLEALVEKLEAENGTLRATLADGRNSPNYMAPSAEREERRAEGTAEAAPAASSDDPESANRGIGTVLFVEHKSTPPTENTVVKRQSEEAKRAFLLANGWNEHGDIYEQNIPVCWEHGAKWQTLDDAYETELIAQAKLLLTKTGWHPVVGGDGFERWQRENGDPVLFHHALRAADPDLSRKLHPTAYVNGAA
jgi:hypothetical protein